MQTKVKGTRVQYTLREALDRYEHYCHSYHKDILPIKEMKFDEQQNMVRLFGYDGQLVHAFMPEMMVDGNHKIERRW
jgi:hypothetical protein